MKFITHFATEAEYQTALPTLDLPNVSLVDELQEVHYHRALYGGHAGDLVLFDVAEQQKILVTAADWNLTTYPTATYPIVGIVAFDETPAGLTLVATHSFNADGTKNLTGNTQLKWQITEGYWVIDWGLPKKETENAIKADFNGKSNTTTALAAIKAYDLAHSTDNITGCVGQGIQLYSTEGTLPGDWYIPAGGEFYALYQNNTTVTATIDKLRSADTTLAYHFNTSYCSSTESRYAASPTIGYSSDYIGALDNKINNRYVRAFLRLN